MAATTNISWTDATWNIARGCTKVDEDCKFCYMYRDSFDSHRYNPLEVVKTKTVFNFPLRYKETTSAVWEGRPLLFTSSLTDVFHEGCDSFRPEMWAIIRKCPHLIFQILTKRPHRIIDNLPEYWDEIKERVWLGTSIGSQKAIDRLSDLIAPIQPGIKFLSLEPMHGRIDLPLEDFVDFGHKVKNLIDWVIVGGESGNETGKYRYRPCELEWLIHVVNQCREAEIPVFVKQLGTYLSKSLNLSDRHGANINDFPPELQYRQFPSLTPEPELQTV